VTDYEVWAEAFPDKGDLRARITSVRPPVVDGAHRSPVGAQTWATVDMREVMANEVEDLFRVFVWPEEGTRVVVHLAWLEGPPPGLDDE
jgi:hypothetical protein